jgi:hypothetical protein
VDVEDAVGVRPDEPGRHDMEKPGHDHKVRLRLFQCAKQRAREFVPVGVVPARNDITGNPGRTRALKRKGVRPGGNNGGDPSVFQFSRGLCVKQRLQVCSAPGNQYGDVQQSRTPSSPAIIRPASKGRSPQAARSSIVRPASSSATASRRPMPMLKVLYISRAGMPPAF